MINSLQLIRNVGQFDYVNAGGVRISQSYLDLRGKWAW